MSENVPLDPFLGGPGGSMQGNSPDGFGMVRSHGPAGHAGRSIFIDFTETGVSEVLIIDPRFISWGSQRPQIKPSKPRATYLMSSQRNVTSTFCNRGERTYVWAA
eukprot:scaffold31546_cov66-Phaeocystis_antarctica.AAC.5